MITKYIRFYILFLFLFFSYLSSGIIGKTYENEEFNYYVSFNIFDVNNNKFVFDYDMGDFILIVKPFINNEKYYVNVTIRPLSYEEFKLREYYMAYSVVIKKDRYVINEELLKYFENIYNAFINNNESVFQEAYNKYLNWTPAFLPLTLVYEIDPKTNYLINYSNFGFFPLYSFEPIDKKFVEEVEPVYLGAPVEYYNYVETELNAYNLTADEVVMSIVFGNIVLGDYRQESLIVKFKWNYMVAHHGHIILPLNESHYLFLNAFPMEHTLEYFLSLPDYDPAAEVRKARYIILSIFVVILMFIVGMLYRRWRGR